ncbi:DciA family protein [Neisseria sp. ZJ106]|uniref:DciA family protein n=1 Tax=Neisseria lisongii TaxID=2912188 RepID=A0ABY7RJQ2_9NEIS|nr:DciA family protein [Neisseria lisongii]MCF7521221.1 DciA family protein [Neisseria lisongii]WCL71713.1 DciA family protein [Neisseria lisongii]
MDLTRFGRKDHHLSGLLQQAQQWRLLDGRIKELLPANLRPHFQTACVKQGCLVLLAANGMASSRLKMIVPSLLPQLQRLDDRIDEVQIRVLPRNNPPPKTNRLQLSTAALSALEQTAQQVGAKHPELSAALSALAGKHRNGS